MVFTWLRNRRRNRLVNNPFPHEWRDVLTQRVRHYEHLDSDRRARLESFTQVFAAEKDWAGAGGLVVTDEMKVTIAGYAGVMTLGLPESYFFDRLKTVILNNDAYRPKHVEQRGYIAGRPPARFGESWQWGPIKLSWQEIAGNKFRRPGDNLVFHEFAHHIDGLDGGMDGTPAVGGPEQQRHWNEVVEQEFKRLRSDASQGYMTLLDPYGASNRAEFFAVSSECFFERPGAMRAQHPELYQLLADFYCQDVTSWLPDATP